MPRKAAASGSAVVGSGTAVLTLPLTLLAPNPFQPRRHFPEDRLRELAGSITRHGLIEPIIVRPVPGGGVGYQIISGERRVRAMRLLDPDGSIEAIVRDRDDLQAEEDALVENVQRENLDPVEEACAFHTMHHRHGQSWEYIASRVGRSANYVEEGARLALLPPEVQEQLSAGELSRAQGLWLCRYHAFPAAVVVIAAWVRGSGLSGQALANFGPYGLPYRELHEAEVVRSLVDATFDIEICNACPFHAKFGNLCFTPDHYDDLTKRAAAENLAEPASVIENGVQLTPLSLMAHGTYRNLEFEEEPQGCGPQCPCRARAINRQNLAIDICADPARFDGLRARQRRAERQQHRVAVRNQRDTLAAYFGGMAVSGVTAMGSHHLLVGIVARALGSITRSGPVDTAVAGLGLSDFPRWGFERVAALAALDGDQLLRLAGEALCLDELHAYEQNRDQVPVLATLLLPEASQPLPSPAAEVTSLAMGTASAIATTALVSHERGPVAVVEVEIARATSPEPETDDVEGPESDGIVCPECSYPCVFQAPEDEPLRWCCPNCGWFEGVAEEEELEEELES